MGLKGKTGENPARSRHCDWGENHHEATGFFTWEGRWGSMNHESGDLPLPRWSTSYEDRRVDGESGLGASTGVVGSQMDGDFDARVVDMLRPSEGKRTQSFLFNGTLSAWEGCLYLFS